MANNTTVCCMCGDVGFADKLFQCFQCHFRFQHSYCTNYYAEESPKTAGICDWCLSEERNASRHGFQFKNKHKDHSCHGYTLNSHKVKHITSDQVQETGARSKNPAGSSSSKPPGRRYKLLKDVLC